MAKLNKCCKQELEKFADDLENELFKHYKYKHPFVKKWKEIRSKVINDASL